MTLAAAEPSRPVRTRWVAVNGCAGPPLQGAATPPPHQQPAIAEQLQHLARHSLARGHWRVALRRILMARATGCTLAPDMDEALARYLPRLSIEEVWKMQDAASRWMLMTRGIALGAGW